MAESIGLKAILDDSNFRKGLASYTAGIGSMVKMTDGAAKAIGGAFKLATGALLVGAGSVVGILGASVKAAADAEQVSAQVDAVLQSTKGVAGVTRKAVDDLATSLSELTPFEDDAIAGGEAMLLTFTNIGKNVFPDVTEVMLDMSQAMKQDLKSSALQLGKALQDPAEGLSALSRVGVKFTKQQEDMVKSLVKAGKVEDAQRIILKELQTEFGGAAKAAGKTFAGQLQILQNSLGNIMETIGGALLPTLTKLAGALTKALADPKVKAGIENLTNWLTNDLAPGVERLWKSFEAGGLQGVLAQIATEIRNAWPAISAELAKWGAQFWTWLTGPGGALETGIAEIQKVAGKVAAWLGANWDSTIKPALLEWAGKFWTWVTDPSSGVLVTLSSRLAEVVEKIKAWSASPETKAGLVNAGETVANTIIDAIDSLFKQDEKGNSLMGTLAQTLLRAVVASNETFMNIGGSLAEGVVRGIVGKFTGDNATVQRIVDALQWLFDQALKVFNPTGWMMQHVAGGGSSPPPSQPTPGYASGGWVMRTGLARVHAGEYVIPARQAQSIINNNTRTIGPGSIVVNVTGTVYGEMDMQRVFRRALDSWDRSAIAAG